MPRNPPVALTLRAHARFLSVRLPSVDRTLGRPGLFCPILTLRIPEGFRAMAVGRVFTRSPEDPASHHDIRSSPRRTGNDIVEATKDGSLRHFLVHKTG